MDDFWWGCFFTIRFCDFRGATALASFDVQFLVCIEFDELFQVAFSYGLINFLLWTVRCYVCCLYKTGNISSGFTILRVKPSWEVPLRFVGIWLYAESPFGRISAGWNCHTDHGSVTILVAVMVYVLNKIIVHALVVVPCLPETVVFLYYPLIFFSKWSACSVPDFYLDEFVHHIKQAIDRE